jgi:hypothetical protein
MRVTLNEQSHAVVAPAFQYKVMSRELRVGDIVDGIWRNQFVYDVEVIRPNCLEYGYDGLRGGDYQVEVRIGMITTTLYRNDISNVRRPYQCGDWAK